MHKSVPKHSHFRFQVVRVPETRGSSFASAGHLEGLDGEQDLAMAPT